MARVRVLDAFLAFAIFGLLAHNALADVSHVVNRGYLPAVNGISNELFGHLPNYEIKYPEIDLTPPEPKPAYPFKSLENEAQYRAPAYLPPHQSFAANHQTAQHYSYGAYDIKEQKSNHENSVVQHVTIKVPTYLPPGYDYNNPNQGQSSPESKRAEFKASTYLPPDHNFKSLRQEQNSPEGKHNTYQQNVESTVSFQLPVDLPAGYDFVRPEGAEEAIAELHTLPDNDNQNRPKVHQQQNSAFPIQQLTTGYLPQMGRGKIRTVQILNSVAVKTLRVLETETNGVKHIKILGHSNHIPTGEHRVVRVEAPGSYVQIVKIFNNHHPDYQQQDYVNSKNYYGNTPAQGYLPPQESHLSHKRSVRVSSESYPTSL